VSKIPRVSYVVEGATDFIVLDTIVEKLLGSADYIPTQIQPPSSEYAAGRGPLGVGWKGVLRWCEAEGNTQSGFNSGLTLSNCDLLVIHVDADIAHEADLSHENLKAPCPPAKATCDRIRDYLTKLIGNNVPTKVVLCVPAQCTEAWVYCALHPSEAALWADLECRDEIERVLIGKPDKLVRDKGGSAKKLPERYRVVAPRLGSGWLHAIRLCAEAMRFNHELETALNANHLKGSG